MRKGIYIGTSGWMYRHWKDGWYGKTPQRKWLSFDADRFTAIEIDGTFYGSKKREVFEKWSSEVPDGFRLAVRGHRFVTHYKRLKNVSDSVKRLRDEAMGLGAKLGPVLWQTPPNMKLDLDRLKCFADDLRAWPEARHVMEFRNESWFIADVCKVLKDNRLAICISDGGGIPRWDETSTDLVYVRLHGRRPLYVQDYDEDALRDWARKVEGWRGKEVHVYFDNDAGGHAPHNALRLMELVGVKTSRPIETADRRSW